MREYFRKPYMTQGIGKHSDYMKAIPQRAIDVQGLIAPNIEFKKPYDYHPNTAQMIHYYANNLHYLGGDPVPPLNDPSLLPHAPIAETPVEETPVFDYGSYGDSYTSLLLHMDKTGGAFIDSSLSRKIITTVGDAQQTTSKSVFGGSSGQFNAGYLSTPADASFNTGTGEYTLDFWFNTTKATTPGGVNMIPLYQGDSVGISSTVSQVIQIGIVTANKLSWSPNYKSYPSHTWITTSAAINDGLWYHVACVRSGDNHILFLDGQQQGSTLTLAGYTAVAATDPYFVGKQNATYHQYVGWMDEVHISKGIARWTANFTPPTKAW